MALKFALTTAGAVLALAVLRPAVTALADAAGTPSTAARLELLRATGAASIVLVVAVVLSVAKPFGRVRGRAPGDVRARVAVPPR